MALKRSAVRSRLGPHITVERDRSSAWLERRPVKAEVAGSSPVGPASRRETLGSQEPGVFYLSDE